MDACSKPRHKTPNLVLRICTKRQNEVVAGMKVVSRIHSVLVVTPVSNLDAQMKRAHTVCGTATKAISFCVMVDTIRDMTRTSSVVIIKQLEKARNNCKTIENIFPGVEIKVDLATGMMMLVVAFLPDEEYLGTCSCVWAHFKPLFE